ncbi:hypothetical protein MNV49_002642 [Pseudohyphozyma bogoriensis]|nr:hypothetical protein MNV49_002642 [Pseudohyphozyma bogoriensis]
MSAETEVPGQSLAVRPPPIQHDPDLVREPIAGPEAPGEPYPIYLEGWVERGFGRGSKDLGCPTANLPDSSIAPYATTLSTGVYYGFARVLDPLCDDETSAFSGTVTPDQGERTAANLHDEVWPMVMSIGWNPYYNNDTRTAEVHILHEYPHDFYGKELRSVILGFVRPEYNYNSLDALIKDINFDKEVAERSVDRPAYLTFKDDAFFTKKSELVPPTRDPNAKREKPGDE